MLKKNQIIPLTVTAMSAEGSGIGRYTPEGETGGLAVFVPFTAIGDRISCRIVRVQKNLAYGIAETVEEPSPDRCAERDCAAFGRCGGCVYRHISYEAECRSKYRRVADALHRIGGLTLEPEPLVPCAAPDRYRNKGQFPVAQGKNGLQIGFYAPRSHRIVEQRDCRLQPAAFQTALAVVEAWIKTYRVPIYDETTGKGLLRHIYLRQAADGALMVTLVCTAAAIPAAEPLVEALRAALPQTACILVNVNRKDTNVVLGSKTVSLFGPLYLTDTLCELKFRLSPLSFYQVNHDQAERLYGLAADAAALTADDILLDLYCGTGTIGLTMAHRVKQLIGVEVVPEAVEDARRNAEENGIGNARFLAADAAVAAAQLSEEGVHPTVVVLDPPRKGCDAALIHTVAEELCPRRVVYVSCDPATLARDLKLFGELGYDTERVIPVDMFPRTAHVESVALLVRTDSAE